MQFKEWFINENVDKQRVLAPIGSEWKEKIVKIEPFNITISGNTKEQWNLIYTQFETPRGQKISGRVLITLYPDDTNSFMDGGFVWTTENMKPIIINYYLDQYSSWFKPQLIKAAHSLGIKDISMIQ